MPKLSAGTGRRVPQPSAHPERRAGGVRPLPPAPEPLVSHTRNAPLRWNREAGGTRASSAFAMGRSSEKNLFSVVSPSF